MIVRSAEKNYICLVIVLLLRRRPTGVSARLDGILYIVEHARDYELHHWAFLA
jgi:hypothetical protein